MTNEKTYPFKEGDDYWSVLNGTLIWSCWDDISEEFHDENPNREYFTNDEALDVARANGIKYHSHKMTEAQLQDLYGLEWIDCVEYLKQ